MEDPSTSRAGEGDHRSAACARPADASRRVSGGGEAAADEPARAKAVSRVVAPDAHAPRRARDAPGGPATRVEGGDVRSAEVGPRRQRDRAAFVRFGDGVAEIESPREPVAIRTAGPRSCARQHPRVRRLTGRLGTVAKAERLELDGDQLAVVAASGLVGRDATRAPGHSFAPVSPREVASKPTGRAAVEDGRRPRASPAFAVLVEARHAENRLGRSRGRLCFSRHRKHHERRHTDHAGGGARCSKNPHATRHPSAASGTARCGRWRPRQALTHQLVLGNGPV